MTDKSKNDFEIKVPKTNWNANILTILIAVLASVGLSVPVGNWTADDSNMVHINEKIELLEVRLNILEATDLNLVREMEAYNDTTSDLSEELDRLRENLKEIKEDLQQDLNDLNKKLPEYEDNDREINNLKVRMSDLEKDIENIEEDIEDLEDEI